MRSLPERIREPLEFYAERLPAMTSERIAAMVREPWHGDIRRLAAAELERRGAQPEPEPEREPERERESLSAGRPQRPDDRPLPGFAPYVPPTAVPAAARNGHRLCSVRRPVAAQAARLW